MIHPIELTDAPDEAFHDLLSDELTAFNIGNLGHHGRRPLALIVRGEDGAVRGGLWGRTSWNWLFIELLYLPETMRGAGTGAELLCLAEREAVRRGCVGAWLDTLNAEASRFYVRHGYEVFGTIPGYPGSNHRFFHCKRLAGGHV